MTADPLPFARRLLGDLRGPLPPVGFCSNFCTFSPDFWPPLLPGRPWSDLRPACHLHDYHYSPAQPLGADDAAREVADVLLWWNLQRCGAPAAVAALYYRRVRLLGAPHFAYAPGARPTGVRSVLARALHRYRIPRGLLATIPVGPSLAALVATEEALLA